MPYFIVAEKYIEHKFITTCEIITKSKQNKLQTRGGH